MRNIQVTLLATAALVLAALPALSAPTTETADTGVMELKWLGPYYLDSEPQPPEGNMMQQLIEERFNVKIEIANISSADNEKLPLWFAEGNTADYVSVKLAFGQSLVDQGLLRSYPKEWLWEHAPEWTDRMEAMFGDRLEREMTYKGEAWALPYNNWAEVESSYLPLVRKDWMDNLGITEDPVTIEEHFELLKRFTHEDPDGDGKADTYGMSHISFVYGLGFSWVFAAYGYQDKSFYVKDGQVIYANSQDEYKQALKTLAEWYEAGVIDPTFATNKGGEFYDGWGMGDFGLNWQPPVALTSDTPRGPKQLVWAHTPDAEFKFLPPPQGPEGLYGAAMPYPSLFIFGNGGAFGHEASDEKVIKIMQMQNEILADRDLFNTLVYGMEGVHWDRGSEGEIKIKVEEAKKAHHDGVGFWGRFPILRDEDPTLTSAAREVYDWVALLPVNYWGVAFTHDGVNEVYAAKRGDLNTISNEFYHKAITGVVDIDEAWDQFQADLNAAGLDEVIAEFQRLYDALN